MNLKLSFIGLINILIFIIYVHNNIINFGGEGTSKLELLIFFSTGVYLIWKRFINLSHSLNNSFKYILIFFLYFAVKLLIEFDSLSRLKEYTIGSTGGVLFSYLLGLILSLSSYHMLQLKNIKIINLFTYIFIIFFSLISYSIQKNALSKISNLRFIIEDLDGNYQRSGSFISIIFILLSVILLKSIFINKLYSKPINIIVYILFYITNSFSLIFFSQMIGSNSSLLIIMLCTLLSLSFMFLTLIRHKKKVLFNYYYSKYKNKSKINYKFIFIPAIKRIIIGSSIIIGLFYLIISYLDFDINQTRIMNYGNSESITPTSITSRIEILNNNLLTHLDYNPFIGSMRVDEYTTGKGTYAHSLPLSLLTHLGIVGLILFLLIVNKTIKEQNNLIFNMNVKFYNSSLIVYRKYLLILIIITASLTTFFTWMVLWFIIGLVSLPVKKKRMSKKSPIEMNAFLHYYFK